MTQRGNSSGGIISDSDLEWGAYDLLPGVLREALRDSVQKYSSASVYQVWLQRGTAGTLALLRTNDQRAS